MTYEKTVAAEYFRLRKEHPYNPAKQTLLWARGNVKPLALEWTTYEGQHLAVGRGHRDGFDIRVVVDQSQEVTSAYSFTDEDTGIRNPNYRWEGGDSYSGGTRFLELESESTVRDLAPYYHKVGDAKNVAWERARQSLQEEAEAYIDGEVVEVFLTAEVSVKGALLGTDSIGSDVMVNDLERECDNIVAETGIIEQTMAEAREEAVALREALSTIA